MRSTQAPQRAGRRLHPERGRATPRRRRGQARCVLSRLRRQARSAHFATRPGTCARSQDVCAEPRLRSRSFRRRPRFRTYLPPRAPGRPVWVMRPVGGVARLPQMVEDLAPGAAATAPPRAFHLLAKPTGAVCNLDCSYCFFLSKEMLYPGSRFRMAEELLETYIRQLIEAHATVPEVTIAWQGGEPTLMGVEFFRRSVELANHYLRPGQRAVYTIQTNGALSADEWASLVRGGAVVVGMASDGPGVRHDASRVNKGGKGSVDGVIPGVGRLRGAEVEWNAVPPV